MPESEPPSRNQTDTGTDRPRPERLSETGQRVFHCLSLGLVVFDHQLEILHHNPAAEFLIGRHTSIADALSAATVDARYQDWRQALRDVLESGHQQRFDQVVYRHENQGERLLNILCIALTEPTADRITGGTLVIEDVTAFVSMEQRLAVSERLAAVGKLGARVAHELNNPLDGILRYLNLAIRAIEAEHTEKIGDYLTRARGGILRMAEIVRELVQFSRGTPTSFDETGLNAIVEEAVKVMTDKAMETNVSIICNLNEQVPNVGGTNLFQVFCNLIKNAIDAMPDGGTLTISTDVVDNDVVIQFQDSGIGLPDEIDRIFEPFFTTKDVNKGTGLGLAVCKDIVEKNNGTIVPHRRSEGGSSFIVRLPVKPPGTLHAGGPGAASGTYRARLGSSTTTQQDQREST